MTSQTKKPVSLHNQSKKNQSHASAQIDPSNQTKLITGQYTTMSDKCCNGKQTLLKIAIRS